MLVTKGVSSGETLLKTENCTHETDKGVGKAGIYWVLMLYRVVKATRHFVTHYCLV